MHKRKKLGTICSVIAVLAFFLFSQTVFAEGGCPPGVTGRICLENPISADSIPVLVNLILKGLFGIVGTVALVMFIYGGFTWMTAQGAEKKIKQGWDTLTWGALGLVLIFGSYIIVQFLLGILLKPPGPDGGGGTGAAQQGGANLDSLKLNDTTIDNPVGGFPGEPLRLDR